jgi:hypothetical protein
MIFTRFRPDSPAVVRLRATTRTDSYGDTAEDWTLPSWLALPEALVQDRTSTETDGSGRSITRTEKVLLHPGALDLTARDRVELDGVTYRIEGEPSVRRGLRGASHTTAVLRRVTG